MKHAIVGCLLGTAVGDALGLPYEGLSPNRAHGLLGPPDRYRFCFGRGMISDDTEHTCMVAQSLIESGNDVNEFTRRFARRLRWWILAFPAGVGKATALSGFRLWLGAKLPTPSATHGSLTDTCGVFSAGNGPAMRATIFGAAIGDREVLLAMVRASTRLTHTDPKAEFGAVTVALAARESRKSGPINANLWLQTIVDTIGEQGVEFSELLSQAVQSATSGEPTQRFAESLGLGNGVTGYTYHTVPVAIHAWLSNPKDFRRAVTTTIRCGGDADTTAAIVGGIVGAGVGREGLPKDWLDGLRDWPRSLRWIENLGIQLASSRSAIESNECQSTQSTVSRVNLIAVIIRNLVFLFVVLFHGFRRLAPPY
ncbi:ADP-ribosylglycohydrolase family protein [Aporhodopirellula aestuarii]|uniref:ADP-ribosylglycohydrolase family protein n=1 Tax=Aporhodopirellula aestuarii TaxID=2950107 RepID=A0ABT0U3E7_9BACT|nr:ADP-ribosylglycohydrolase family protein [Aporhodopirellula aestuarii]MCM2371420.1 ADP-ribosylglycohydrolase family protein [Aporhodopirellula aestuarii]